MTSARLDAFARGAICALADEGVERAEIQKKVNKKDGTRPHIRAIDAVLAKKREDPEWRGQDSQAGGRPRALTDAQQRQLVALVFKNRGRAVVTTAFCKRRLRFLRKVCSQTVCNALQAAGLKWLHLQARWVGSTKILSIIGAVRAIQQHRPPSMCRARMFPPRCGPAKTHACVTIHWACFLVTPRSGPGMARSGSNGLKCVAPSAGDR